MRTPTLALLFLTALPALADTYRVELPTSQTAMAESAAHQPRLRSYIELGVSTWSPSEFRLPGRIGADQALTRGDLPGLFLGFPVARTGLEGLTVQGGLNWASLRRNASLGYNGIEISQLQTVQLLSAKLGLEYSPELVSSRVFSPFVGFSGLPSLAFAGRSSFDSGSAYGGFPFEWSAGTRARVGIELLVGVSGTFGSVGGSSVAGLGAKAGVRMPL